MVEIAQRTRVSFGEIDQRKKVLCIALQVMIDQFQFLDGWSEERIGLYNKFLKDEKFLHYLFVSFSHLFAVDSQKRIQAAQCIEEFKAYTRDVGFGSLQDKDFFCSFFHTLLLSIRKTTFFVPASFNAGALSFRIDPAILWEFFSDKKFLEKPYAIFFVFSPNEFIGFHIRFQELARGGLRTVYISDQARRKKEQQSVFFECYQLALTQEKKNKDIPEGGAKGIIFCQNNIESNVEEALLFTFQQKYIQELLLLVNYNEGESCLKEPAIVDYYTRAEYLYLGPDERLKDYAVDWIASYAAKVGYLPGHVFITSKTGSGINHKLYGVTSQGIVAWIEAAMNRLFKKDCINNPCSLIMTGGPDGDVASNTIKIIAKRYPKTACFIGIRDKSGFAYDPLGLKMEELLLLIEKGNPIRFYPFSSLSKNGFIQFRDQSRQAIHSINSFGVEQIHEEITQENYENFLFSIPSNVFVPAGGRPYSITEENVSVCLKENGTAAFSLIVEGANLFFSHAARDFLEKKGVAIVKDSSANKGGVISSSFEVLTGLILSKEEFIFHKQRIIQEIIERIQLSVELEASLLFSSNTWNEKLLTDRSMLISEKIRVFAAIVAIALKGWDPRNTYIQNNEDDYTTLLLCHALPLLRQEYRSRLLLKLPLDYQRACVAAYLSSMLVYTFGISYELSVETVLQAAKQLINEKKLST